MYSRCFVSVDSNSQQVTLAPQRFIVEAIDYYQKWSEPIQPGFLLSALNYSTRHDGLYLLVPTFMRYMLPHVYVSSKLPSADELEWLKSLPKRFESKEPVESIFNLKGVNITVNTAELQCTSFQHKFYRAYIILKASFNTSDLGKFFAIDMLDVDYEGKAKMMAFVKTNEQDDSFELLENDLQWRKLTCFESMYFSHCFPRQYDSFLSFIRNAEELQAFSISE